MAGLVQAYPDHPRGGAKTPRSRFGSPVPQFIKSFGLAAGSGRLQGAAQVEQRGWPGQARPGRWERASNGLPSASARVLLRRRDERGRIVRAAPAGAFHQIRSWALTQRSNFSGLLCGKTEFMRDFFFASRPRVARRSKAQRRSNNTPITRTYVPPAPHDIEEVVTLSQTNSRGRPAAANTCARSDAKAPSRSAGPPSSCSVN